MVTANTYNDVTTIVLRPNRSADWHEIKVWLAVISIPALIVALGWFFVGVWIILPFAGLELGLLCYFMYRVCYQNYREQHITIERDNVILSSGIGKPEQHYVFTRPDCYLAVKQATKPIENLELALQSETQTFAIGEFLNPEDRECARRSIRNAGVIECSSCWWENHHK